MTGDKSKFVNLPQAIRSCDILGTTTKEKFLEEEPLATKNTFLINDVLFMEGLKHILLSISQFCDKGYQITFKPNTCEIKLSKS